MEAINLVQETPTMPAVRDNKALHRFELDAEGQVAFANYRLTPQAIIITHTETPRALRGRGIASELVKGALEMIRADGRKVIAGCGFVVDYLNKHRNTGISWPEASPIRIDMSGRPSTLAQRSMMRRPRRRDRHSLGVPE